MDQNFNIEEIPNVKPIRDIVYENLKKAIVAGKIKQGERIVEQEYAEKLNVSRTPIREALRKLEMEGFVEYIPRKGVVVKNYSEKDIAEIYDIREALETLAVKYTIENITEDELIKLKKSIEKMIKARDKGDVDEVFKACKTFNDTIIQSCRALKLNSMISTLQKYISGCRHANLKYDPLRLDEAVNEHREICEAVEEKNVEKAQLIIRKHLQSSKACFFDKIEENKK